MKKTKLILLALIGLFVFNSCEDKDPVDTKPSTEAYKTIVELKSLTGISVEQVIIKLADMGYNNHQSFGDGEVSIIHFFAHDSLPSMCLLLEYNNLICLSGYMGTNDKGVSLNHFENYSNQCVAYMTGKTYEYEGEIEDMDNESLFFTTHQDNQTYYMANKLNILSCIGSWESTTEVVLAEYEEDDGEYYANIAYTNTLLAPPEDSTKKSMIKEIFKSYKK